ncbi:human immunodeficiency virus type I enhancer-binding protein 2 homolog, partial [Trichomycterus rosablanca]|uniref:human immunodeficiency virus type I enhancer-binding protein 2 homolog n=1 Tax=Trichomycterus rosablanca TaxID=2290929 RepID=UPI002F352FE8
CSRVFPTRRHLKQERHSNSKMAQQDHISGPEDNIEKPHTDDIRSCSSIETKTESSGGAPFIQSVDQNPAYTWRKTPTIPFPGTQCFQSDVDFLSESLRKKEHKEKKAGKYVCHFCGRACAKPSVLKKHIRSHTGERPYPCVPCGFSFKTKSNLYKHRKSHTHAIKSGLLPRDMKQIGTDEELIAEYGEMPSDNEQSTDTDEEVINNMPLDKGTTINTKAREDNVHEDSGKLKQKIPGITFTPSSSMMDTVSSSEKVSLWQFRELMAPAVVSQGDQEFEPSTIKQRLALRLTEKKSQDSDQSLSLPSSYSKGSTDSGYFSRSESAEQQFIQPSAGAKSYQEIMFGKCYRPNTKPRQSITVQTCMTDTNETPSSFMIKLTKGTVPGKATPHLTRDKKDLVRSIKIESESFQEEEDQEMPEKFQCSTDLLETPSECNLLLRSKSLPTSCESSGSASQTLRSSSSFDERMTSEDVSFRSSVGIRKLMRQAAFEHSAHEGHTESDNHALVCGLKPELKVDRADDFKFGIENCPEFESCLMMEIATRKRRKGNKTMEEEDFPTQNKPSGLSELSGDRYSKQDIQDATYSDTERKTGSNVISVIQHTKSLSRPSSAEKAPDFESQQINKSSLYQFLEKKHIKEEHTTDLFMNYGKMESQRIGGSLPYQRSYMSKPLGVPFGIQVPEIRVTEEPDKPEKIQNVQVRPNDKNKEEFQWPQRSETLSNFPVEKLPPKKKRLRLAELECSSGESSFESACTSLSRSPSQDSNLSHSSSFSQSLDREESVNVASQSKSDEFGKPLEFLCVPGSLLSQQREMRRSASEQVPCNLPMELPEFRSKSFDYSNLSSSSSPTQWDTNVSSFGSKERRRGYLVRQASLSFDPEICDKSSGMNAIQGSSDPVETSRKVSSPDKQLLLEGSFTGIEKMRHALIHGCISPQQLISPDLSWIPEQISYHRQPLYPKTLQMHQYHGLKYKIKREPEELKSADDSRIALTDVPKDNTQSVTSVLSSIAVLSQAQPALANQSLCGLFVPVRFHMQVPCFGNITYTSISHILDFHNTSNIATSKFPPQNSTSLNRVGPDLTQTSGHPREPLNNPQTSPAKLKTGIPLSLTSRTISTTEAPSGGASKRMLSPTSSIELLIESTQQKRVKDEKMYGQIVEELSAVELGHPDHGKEKMKKKNISTNIQDSTVTVEEVDMEDPEPLPSGISEENSLQMPIHITTSQVCGISTSALPRDIASAWMLSQFLGLHTTTCVSWCYLNSTKPNSTLTAPHFSVYASWFVKCHNPNPPTLNTGIALGLLRSKQKRQNATYTTAAMCQPGILVTSALLSQKQDQGTVEARVDICCKTRTKEIKHKSRPSSKDPDVSVRHTEPVRIKIFEGGFKSNEDYVYVRGRGRGKYICEECGIRCKKPSMLKKHIRTHTDVRPYICKCCNFAFKTKGNLTKHMKSKAHLKKCLELGVSPMNVDNTDFADHEDAQKSSDIRMDAATAIKHQFSDVDDSDVGDEDGDEPDDEEDDEYDYSTPRTQSRSTSPQSYTVNKPFSSICITKSNEDDQTLDQASTSVDTSTSQLLSPCWDTPYQRYRCLKGDLSPQGHLSPPRVTSPLRPLSPRKDLKIRGDLSPVRQLSPLRPISPGADVTRYRAPSPRGQHKGRGTYQHRSFLDPARGMRCESAPLRQSIGTNPEMNQLEVSDNIHSSNNSSTVSHQGIFSHLPLHSQSQLQTPIPMVPIGGLRMPFVLPSCAAAKRNSSSLPQGDISERANFSQASVSILEPRISNPSPQRNVQQTSSPGFASKDKKQEESVQICAQAIASLKITSEDTTDKPPDFS